MTVQVGSWIIAVVVAERLYLSNEAPISIPHQDSELTSLM
jgi:hypothetical protein